MLPIESVHCCFTSRTGTCGNAALLDRFGVARETTPQRRFRVAVVNATNHADERRWSRGRKGATRNSERRSGG